MPIREAYELRVHAIGQPARDTVVRHANCPTPFRVLLRANRSFVLALLWAALAACIAGSLVFDIADWLSAWRGVGFDMRMWVAAIS